MQRLAGLHDKEVVLLGSLEYNAIQCNRSIQSSPHIVAYNHGDSYVVACGNFQGGMLWIQDPSGSTLLSIPLRPSPQLAHVAGARLRGVAVDVRNKAAKLQQGRIHAVQPFTGQRFSMVLFSKAPSHTLPKYQHERLRQLRFLVGHLCQSGDEVSPTQLDEQEPDPPHSHQQMKDGCSTAQTQVQLPSGRVLPVSVVADSTVAEAISYACPDLAPFIQRIKATYNAKPVDLANAALQVVTSQEVPIRTAFKEPGGTPKSVAQLTSIMRSAGFSQPDKFLEAIYAGYPGLLDRIPIDDHDRAVDIVKGLADQKNTELDPALRLVTRTRSGRMMHGPPLSLPQQQRALILLRRRSG